MPFQLGGSALDKSRDECFHAKRRFIVVRVGKQHQVRSLLVSAHLVADPSPTLKWGYSRFAGYSTGTQNSASSASMVHCGFRVNRGMLLVRLLGGVGRNVPDKPYGRCVGCDASIDDHTRRG